MSTTTTTTNEFGVAEAAAAATFPSIKNSPIKTFDKKEERT